MVSNESDKASGGDRVPVCFPVGDGELSISLDPLIWAALFDLASRGSAQFTPEIIEKLNKARDQLEDQGHSFEDIPRPSVTED